MQVHDLGAGLQAVMQGDFHTVPVILPSHCSPPVDHPKMDHQIDLQLPVDADVGMVEKGGVHQDQLHYYVQQ